MQTPTAAARPPKVHQTYLSPEGRAAIAAHAKALKRRRDQHRGAVQAQQFLQAVLRDMRDARVAL